MRPGAHLLPNLVDEDWHEDALQRLGKLYRSQEIDQVATAMVKSHRHAIQYLEQAPALLAFVVFGKAPRTAADYLWINRRFGEACHRGPKLRDLLAEFRAPLQIRKIHGELVSKASMSGIVSLRQIPPSDLAQAIPDKIGQQRRFIRSLMRLGMLMDWRAGDVLRGPDFVRWHVMHSGIEARAGKTIDDIREISDYLRNNPAGWTPQTTLAAIRDRVERWHEQLAQRQDADRFLMENGVTFDEEADYRPLVNECRIGDFDFIALKSGEQLFVEGAAMRHCVASYTKSVFFGGSRIYSIRMGGRRVATLQLRFDENGLLKIAQIKGPCNSAPSANVHKAAAEFMGRQRDLTRGLVERRREWIGRYQLP